MIKQESQLQKSLLSQEQALELEESQLRAAMGGSPISEAMDVATIAVRKRTASEAGLSNFNRGGDKVRLLPASNGSPVPLLAVVNGKRIIP